MEALWITLVCTVPIIIVAFVISFERMAKHERDLRYYTNSLENHRVEMIKLWNRMEPLYKKDEHSFGRPKADLVREEMDRHFGQVWEKIGDLEQKKGGN